MSYMEQYRHWREKASDEELARELRTIAGDESAIEDRFYRELEFGTGGLRGVLGAGSNRMNVYTVAKATQGLSGYLRKNFEVPSAAIAYDSRIHSDLLICEKDHAGDIKKVLENLRICNRTEYL